MVPHSRWAAYATASAATTFGCAASATAEIMYSGPINRHLNAPVGNIAGSFVQLPLDPPLHSLLFQHVRRPGDVYGYAVFTMVGYPTGSVAGFVAGRSSFQYVSKLSFGQTVNSRPFIPGNGGLAFRDTPNAQWLEPGTGFVGFRFDGGADLQYGWARINMDGLPANSFTLVDYAFADPGEQIRAGQTTSTSVPESGGSLGLFALGCAGLLAWRAARRDSAVA